MTTARHLQASLPQQALSLGLAALVTAGVLSGLLGWAGSDQGAQLAQRLQATPQAVAQPGIAQPVVAPQA